MISKFGKRTASITLIFVVCITMLFSGSGVSKVFAEEPTKPDIEVSGLEGKLGKTIDPDGSLSFDLTINHKVSKGDTIDLRIGYDKVDSKDLPPHTMNVQESSVTTSSGDVVGTVTAYGEYFTLIFNDKAEKYDRLQLKIESKNVYDIDIMTKDGNDATLDLNMYMELKNPDGTYSKIEGSDGIFKREINPIKKMDDYLIVLSKENGASAHMRLGDANINNLHDGNIVVTIPAGMEVENVSTSRVLIDELTKPGGEGFYTLRGVEMRNSISLVKTEGNNVIFAFEKDKFKDLHLDTADLALKYKDGFSYTDNPYREVKADFTGIGGGTHTLPIKNGEITAGGTGTILDLSKYDLTADPIILHKGDKVPDNSAICDKVTIKDKADGKTVTADEIGADKTRTDNNVIDTNKPGDYSATVTVQYKDKSVKNVTVPIKVIDNVIPVKPGEDGKNPEKPAGYVTVTMDSTSKGHLAEGEASKYYVNPEKEVTIPAKDAIGNLGYKFTAWDKALKGTFKEDTTITAQYANIDDVIPVKPGEDGKTPEKPAGYVTVTMDPTDKGHLAESEASQYYVNPEKEVTIPAKDAIGNLGYKFTAWDKALKGTFKEDTTITAQYANIDDVIPVKPGEDGKTPEKPAGYVTVTMEPTDKGHLAEGEASKYYVNPEKEVTIPAKDAIGNVGYKFIAWDKALKGTFKEDTKITAQYNKLPDVIANVPDENGNKPTKPDGYVTIKVDPGENGKLDPRDPGEYFVNPNKDVLIPLHDAIANDGYKFSKWNPNNKGRFSKDMTIKAEYMKKKNIAPLTGDTEMLMSYTVLILASAAITIGFRRKRNSK